MNLNGNLCEVRGTGNPILGQRNGGAIGRGLVFLALAAGLLLGGPGAQAQYGANNQTITVSGIPGFYSGSFNIGYGFYGDVLLVTNGGTATIQLDIAMGYNVGDSNNAIIVTGSGSVLTNQSINVGRLSAGNTLTIAQGGTVLTTLGTSQLGNGSSASNNAVIITDPHSVWSNSVQLALGSMGSGNTLTITNGGGMSCLTGYLGNNAGGNSNLLTVTGTGSVWTNSTDIYVGFASYGNALTIADSGTVYVVGGGAIGYNAGGSNNTVTVTGTGSTWGNNGTINVGLNGSGNTLVVTNGGLVNTFFSDASVGRNAGANNNRLVVTGAGSVFRNGGSFYLGYSGNGNALSICGAGAVFSNSAWSYLGYNGVGNTLTITNGGVMTGFVGYLGYNASSSNNSAVITGTNSLWLNNGGSICVGYSGMGNTLTIADSGMVAAAGVVVGNSASSSNNQLVVGGGSLITTNATGGMVDVRRGTLTLTSGTIQARGLVLTNGLAGALNMFGGTLAVSYTSNKGSNNLVLAGGTMQPLSFAGDWQGAMVVSNSVTLNQSVSHKPLRIVFHRYIRAETIDCLDMNMIRAGLLRRYYKMTNALLRLRPSTFQSIPLFE